MLPEAHTEKLQQYQAAFLVMWMSRDDRIWKIFIAAEMIKEKHNSERYGWIDKTMHASLSFSEVFSSQQNLDIPHKHHIRKERK